MNESSKMEVCTPIKAKGVYTIELKDKHTGEIKHREVVENLVTDIFKTLPLAFAMQKFQGTYNPATQMAVNGASETSTVWLNAPADYSLTSTMGLMQSIFLTDDNTPARDDEYRVRGNVIGYVTGNAATTVTQQGNYLKNNMNYMDHTHTQRKFIFTAADGNGVFQKMFLSGYYPTATEAQIAWLKSTFAVTLINLMKYNGILPAKFTDARELNFDPKSRYFYATFTCVENATMVGITIKFRFDSSKTHGIDDASTTGEFALSVAPNSYIPMYRDLSFDWEGKRYGFKMYRNSTTYYIYIEGANKNHYMLTLSSLLSANYAVVERDDEFVLITYSTTQVRYHRFSKAGLAASSAGNVAPVVTSQRDAFAGPDAYFSNLFCPPGEDYVVINTNRVVDIKDFLTYTNTWRNSKLVDLDWDGEMVPSSANAFAQLTAVTHKGQLVEINPAGTFTALYSSAQGVVTSNVLLEHPVQKTSEDILTIIYDLYLENIPVLKKQPTLGERLEKLMADDGVSCNMSEVYTIGDITSSESISGFVAQSPKAQEYVAKYYFEDFLKGQYKVGAGLNALLQYLDIATLNIESFDTWSECVMNPAVAVAICQSDLWKRVRVSPYAIKILEETTRAIPEYAYEFITQMIPLSTSEYVTLDDIAASKSAMTAVEANEAAVTVMAATDAVARANDHIWGYDLYLSESNPVGRVAYPYNVGNAKFAAAAMRFGSTFNYGGWSSTPGEGFMPKPCMLTYAGAVDHYLSPNDYTKREDGVTASRVADTSFGGNAMMEWPKLYTKRETVDGVYKFRCSDIPQGEGWDCWCNYDKNNNEIDHFYTPIYFGSNISSRMRSISGQGNFVFNTAPTEMSYAVANGDGWNTEVLADRLLIQDLLVMMAKSTECQTAFGFGRCSSSSDLTQGTMNANGLFWGSNDQTSGVKVFGMENWWGNIWRRTAGWLLENGIQKVKITRGTRDGSFVTDYNTTGSGYKSIGGATPTGSSGGYISGMKAEAFGRLPYQASGSSSTYEADGLYYSNSGTMYASVGGRWGGIWDYSLEVGPFSAVLCDATYDKGTNIGAALSYKPLAL